MGQQTGASLFGGTAGGASAPLIPGGSDGPRYDGSGEGEPGPGGAGYDLAAVLAATPPELQDDVRQADAQLSRFQMTAVKAQVALVLDISRSMANPNQFITNPVEHCPLQRLINKALSLALLFDDDAEIDVIPFGEGAFESFKVNKDNFKNAISIAIQQAGGRLSGGTNYNQAVRAVRDKYFGGYGRLTQPQAFHEAEPVFCIFATDGAHNREMAQATAQLRSSAYQAVFWKFLCLQGHGDADQFDYLESCDDGTGEFSDRYVDNSDLVVVRSPEDLTMQLVIQEFRGWMVEAHQKGILIQKPPLPDSVIAEEGRKVAEADDGACCCPCAVM